MATTLVTIEGVEVFHSDLLTTLKRGNKTEELRYYLGNEQNIFSSDILYDRLQKVQPELREHLNVMQSLVQLHRFNMGYFEGETRKDNLQAKESTTINPESFNPQQLKHRGMDKNYFGGKTFSDANIDELFGMFGADKNNFTVIDDVLYQKKPSFFISKDGYINYLLNKLNISFELWSKRDFKSYLDIKNELVEKDILESEEREYLEKLKSEFISMFNIEKNIYSIDDDVIIPQNETKILAIKTNLVNAINKAFESTRKGTRGTLLSNLEKMLANFEEADLKGKVDKLTHVFDKLTRENEIYTFVAQRLDKFYDRLLGKFYRIILPELIQQEHLSREEVRLFIIMNVPLKSFNYHSPAKEKLIKQFYSFNEEFVRKFFFIMILRERTNNQLKEYEKLFNSYLKFYRYVVPLMRDYDKVTKQEIRKDKYTDEYTEVYVDEENDEDLTSAIYKDVLENPDYENKNKGNDSESTEDLTKPEPIIKYLPENQKPSKEITIKPKPVRKARNNFREKSIKMIEIEDFLKSIHLDPVDEQILEKRLQGFLMEEIGKELTPIMAKQRVSERFNEIRQKFSPVEKTIKILMD